MIMLLTYRSELREQLKEALEAGGREVAIPPHRRDMVPVLKESRPELIVLDLYLSDPCGADDLKILRESGYQGKIIVLSGPSMMSVLKGAYGDGIHSVVQIPAQIHGRFHLGELLSTIKTCMDPR